MFARGPGHGAVALMSTQIRDIVKMNCWGIARSLYRHLGVGEWGSPLSGEVGPTDTIIDRCRILCGKEYWAARRPYLPLRYVRGPFAALLLTPANDKSNLPAPGFILQGLVAINLLF
jgi:hypothetical protein